MDPYRVPFRFDRSGAPNFRLVNVGNETLRGVSATLEGPGLMPVNPPINLQPSEALDLVIIGRHLARDSSLTVSWMRPNGEGYLWRIVF